MKLMQTICCLDFASNNTCGFGTSLLKQLHELVPRSAPEKIEEGVVKNAEVKSSSGGLTAAVMQGEPGTVSLQILHHK